MVGVLLITHGAVATHLVDTVKTMIGELSLPTDTIEIDPGEEPGSALDRTRAAAATLDAGDGVILLTDAFGATPSNLANAASDDDRWRVVTGLNLPMLVRVYNYPDLELDAMVLSAVEAGRQGIIACGSTPFGADRDG